MEPDGEICMRPSDPIANLIDGDGLGAVGQLIRALVFVLSVSQ